MARVTVEDCVKIVPNRFELTLCAAQRARQISAGSPITVERNNDKNAVVALREIAEETVSIEALEEFMIRSLQRVSPHDDHEADMEDDSTPDNFPALLMSGDDEDDEDDIIAENLVREDVKSELSVFEDLESL